MSEFRVTAELKHPGDQREVDQKGSLLLIYIIVKRNIKRELVSDFSLEHQCSYLVLSSRQAIAYKTLGGYCKVPASLIGSPTEFSKPLRPTFNEKSTCGR